MSEAIVDLVIEDDGWSDALPELAEIAERAADMALSVLPANARNCEICVMACDDARIAELNRQFRDKAGATNVLSWPAFELGAVNAGEPPRIPSGSNDFGGPLFLGDVAIALETVVAEANEASKPLKNHALHLILHGSLHLLGYDHETPEDAALMEGIESRAMIASGLPDPYA